jgi:NTE family protein
VHEAVCEHRGVTSILRNTGRPTRPREQPITAFVLSGGGNQGVSQVGMLRALVERGIVPDVVIGTSAGALNGAAFATAPTAEKVDHLERVWLGLKGEHVFPGGALKRVWNILRRDDHLIPSDGLASVIASAETAATFADTEVPLRVVTADLMTGEEIVFANGPLRPTLLASAALPGIFPPVELYGRRLVDGAVVNLVPISHALAGPVERIFVLDVSDPLGERSIRSPLDVLVRAFAISRDLRFELELQWVPKEIEVVVLPQPVDDRDFFDFSGGERLIDSAYKNGLAALDDLVERPGRQRRRKWWKRLAS